MQSPILNVADLELQSAKPEQMPKGKNAADYDIRWGEIASRIGARRLGYNLTVVAPGKRNCPFHSHREEEEMFFVLQGAGELRYGDERYPLKGGDVIACPPGGPETAHQIINTGDTELRYLALSTLAPVEICEYPDSGKFGVYAELAPDSDGKPQRFRHLARRQDARDYWEGE
ncbi:MAG TPA: cupin domain-containing protein [Gammaproteobacteria bacterium]|nr:cupin domain-containing protein [Gammaproteobacteria bacterium]